jgi:hypothetical protein
LIRGHTILHPRRIASDSGGLPEQGETLVSKLRLLLLMSSLAARCHALLSERHSNSASDVLDITQHSSHLTAEEIENVVRALNAVVENLRTRIAKQSMQEAFLQVRAHASSAGSRK